MSSKDSNKNGSGKGDRDRSDMRKYRDGYERVFGKKGKKK